MLLDPDVTICVRGATDFQSFEDVPSETARKIANDDDAYALIASELYSLGEVRVRIYIYIDSLTVAVLIQGAQEACMGALGRQF